MSLRRKELYEKLVSQIQAPLMKFGEKLSRNKILQILRDAFMLAFPLTIFGSITLIIANFPFLAQTIGRRFPERDAGTGFHSYHVLRNGLHCPGHWPLFLL